MAAVALRRSAKTTPSRSSKQSWSPNFRQVAEDGSRNKALLLASEHEQQSSASNLTLPQQQEQQTDTHMQSARGWTGTVPAHWERPGSNPNGVPVQYQPAGNDFTPLGGANSNSDVIKTDSATSDQDALMPDAPTVHNIATPRRTIGGRCRKWCISAQPASGKRMCAACCMCGTRVSHGEARLQQWDNRETNHHYVHAHCVNGGLGHDHELLPMQAGDQDAIDAVTRQRDTITRTAADTEVLLPLCSGSGSSLNSRAT